MGSATVIAYLQPYSPSTVRPYEQSRLALSFSYVSMIVSREFQFKQPEVSHPLHSSIESFISPSYEQWRKVLCTLSGFLRPKKNRLYPYELSKYNDINLPTHKDYLNCHLSLQQNTFGAMIIIIMKKITSMMIIIIIIIIIIIKTIKFTNVNTSPNQALLGQCTWHAC